MGSKREKSNIAIAILEKLPFLKGTKNYLVAIIFYNCAYKIQYQIFLFRDLVIEELSKEDCGEQNDEDIFISDSEDEGN